MADTLGILVGTDKFMDHVVQLTRAAYAKRKTVQIFFSGAGVLLTRDPKFKELVGKAQLSVCDVSFRSFGLTGNIPGLGIGDFVTHARNAEIITTCDRYLVF